MNEMQRLYGRPWKEREYVVALHYYFANRGSARHSGSDFVRELASLLGRTTASVSMRMENFTNLEANPTRKGLSNGGPLCRKIFFEWKGQPDALKSCAEVFIRELNEPQSLSFEPDDVVLPESFKKYELDERVADGGFGSVFSCIERNSGGKFALKILRPENRFDKETLHRFYREMRILRCVRHENVIRLHDDNLDAQEPFPVFVMDLAERSLAGYLQDIAESGGQNRPYLAPAEAGQIFRAIACAVHALHNYGPNKIIHRDVNPNNILLLSGGTWVLADFGLAKFLRLAATSSSFMSEDGRGPGTTYYAAPEQYRDFRNTDERTDIYALGMLIWELFTKAARHFPETMQPHLPTPLVPVFLRAVAEKHTDRYQTVSELLADFEKALKQMMGSKGRESKAGSA